MPASPRWPAVCSEICRRPLPLGHARPQARGVWHKCRGGTEGREDLRPSGRDAIKVNPTRAKALLDSPPDPRSQAGTQAPRHRGDRLGSPQRSSADRSRSGSLPAHLRTMLHRRQSGARPIERRQQAGTQKCLSDTNRDRRTATMHLGPTWFGPLSASSAPAVWWRLPFWGEPRRNDIRHGADARLP
jgi:hypothetical protein